MLSDKDDFMQHVDKCSWWCGEVLAVTCFGLRINELPSCIAKDIFKALFVDDLAICFRGRSLDTIERHLQQAVNAIQEWATRNGFGFAAHKCKVVHFTAPRSRAQKPPIVRIGNTLLPLEESTKFLGLWWDSHLSFKKHINVLKTQCKEALNLIRVVAHLKWGGDRDTLLMLYRAIVRSKLDYGCIVYGTASNTNLRQLDSIHNSEYLGTRFPGQNGSAWCPSRYDHGLVSAYCSTNQGVAWQLCKQPFHQQITCIVSN